MVKKKITISQLTLAFDQASSTEGRKLPQYAASLSATIGILAFGGVMAWSASGGNEGALLAKEYNMTITIEEFSWIGSVVNIGAAVMSIPIGILLNIVGRKASMLMMIIPYLIGWGLIIFAKTVTMFIIGRFLLGLCGGALCAAIHIYNGEIAEKNIRGRLGSYVDLMLTSGILLSYILSSFVTIYHLSIILSVIPLIFSTAFSFMPESPVYYLIKNNETQARKSLLILRGPEYDIEEELRIKKDTLLEDAGINRGSFFRAIKSKASINGLIIAYGLMFFQQCSGITAIVFYTTTVFDKKGILSPEISMIISGSMQVFSDSVSSLLVDRLGRRVLLLSSITVMTICTFSLGTYFYLENNKFNVSTFSWIPLVCVSIFFVMSSFGFGSIPWMMIGELFSPSIRGVAGSSACCFSWIMAFVVTRFYNDLVVAFGIHTTFWIFSLISFIGILFVIFIVPETKGKSLEQIQLEIGTKLMSMEIFRR